MQAKRSGVHVYMPAEDDAWLLLALDLQALAEQGCTSAFGRVKSVTLCANLRVRTVFASSFKYDWEVSVRSEGS